MSYSVQKIGAIIGASWLSTGDPSVTVEHLLIDSRQLSFPASSLFFAFRGQRHNGHAYLPSLYQRGLRNFVVSQPPEVQNFPEANILCVDDCLLALQELARYHRQQVQCPVIGITGSNGKTIVKEWLSQLMHDEYNLIRSPKSYNSQIGVPLSLWLMQAEHELAIIEAGISTTGEMERLARMIQPELGVFTNIGSAHDEGFPNTEKKISEKIKLFDSATTIIYCRDDLRIRRQMEQIEGKKLLCWSTSQEADLWIRHIVSLAGGKTRIEGLYQNRKYDLEIPFADAASVENAIHCWMVLLYFQYPSEVIRDRMKQLEPIAMRLELKAGVNNCTIVNDSYNSDLTSLSMALHFVQQQTQPQRRSLVLSDILQSGEDSATLYQKVADLLVEKQIDRVIGIGEAVPELQKFLPDQIVQQYFPSTSAFLSQLQTDDFFRETILLKGARKFEFERIANRLAQKVHKTVLEVDLNALIHNLRVFSRYLQGGTKMMAMVKASAYGSGSIEVARLLAFHQVDYLAVAYADEGVELRKAGIRLPILVLNPETASFETIVAHQLEPEIYNDTLLNSFLQFLGPDRAARIHLKIDTGMHRLGFEGDEIKAAVARIKAFPLVRVASVFSHLAASDAPEHDAFTQRQIHAFQRGCKVITQQLGYTPLRHILNSSGIVRFPQYQMDMVRLGIGLYGVDGTGLLTDQLQVVNSLKATISQIKTVGADETVGYNRSGKLDAAKRIGTISIGYADGLSRAVSNGKYSVYLNGQLAPIVGNVCMDMCMIDLTGVSAAMEGDEVEIFGKHLPVEHLAQSLHTIPYEIFTGISSRVKRIYYQE